MKANSVSRDKQYELIKECRSSGLSDKAWCLAHDINPGTFYNWVKRLKQLNYRDIPDSINAKDQNPIHQDVVKVDIIPDFTRGPQSISPANDTQPNGINPLTQAPTIEVSCKAFHMRFANNADPALVSMIISQIGACS